MAGKIAAYLGGLSDEDKVCSDRPSPFGKCLAGNSPEVVATPDGEDQKYGCTA